MVPADRALTLFASCCTLSIAAPSKPTTLVPAAAAAAAAAARFSSKLLALSLSLSLSLWPKLLHGVPLPHRGGTS
jgi:hypothetical protein